MNRKTIVVAAAAGALMVSAGTAWALGGNSDPATTGASSTGVTSTSTPTSSSERTSTTSESPTTSGTAGVPATRLTADEAARLVKSRLGGGVVHEVEREVEHGRVEWKVEITKDGVTYDIRVDSLSGAVTRVDTDDRDDSTRGADDRIDDRIDDHGGDRDDRDGDNSGPGSDNSGSGRSGGDDDRSGHGGGDDGGGHGGDDDR